MRSDRIVHAEITCDYRFGTVHATVGVVCKPSAAGPAPTWRWRSGR